ncbi:hypothetical protein AGMMS50276_22590 [Synergistales bacterium]|nr:hypothetical protein AGMMS50276_22590 [Synergistales bacterium]
MSVIIKPLGQGQAAVKRLPKRGLNLTGTYAQVKLRDIARFDNADKFRDGSY